MKEATLLVELLTEELPPKSLARLSQSFSETLAADLRQDDFLTEQSVIRSFATPRRLAVSITQVREVAPDSEVLKKGPSVKSALDASGKPTPALLNFARSRGVTVEQLIRVSDGKQEVYAHRAMAKGSHLETNLDLKVEEALKRLPVAKMMRWGAGDAQFVRPVHSLVMMHGSRIVSGTVLGLESGNRTHGHRFLGARDIALANADEYERRLAEEGRVIADFDKRRKEIEGLLQNEAKRLGAGLGEHEDLLDEVTALVELPTVYVGEFDAKYLEVPPECLILTMRQNQKYFPLFGEGGRLLAKFLIVSNMRIPDPRHIVAGNQRVVRPRLEDARFFYDQDRRVRLETRVPQLAKVVYHNKLGTQLERVERLQLLAGAIARRLGADAPLAERTAWLAKADLLTAMVGEFPELQGVMGRYYALNDGEPQPVADAIEAHYHPRFSGDTLPQGNVACAVALADKLDTLVGMFAVGGAPTGERDPYGLRRAALGVLRILIEMKLPLDLRQLLDDAAAGFGKGVVASSACGEVYNFSLDRLRNYLREGGYAPDEIESVISQMPERIDLVPVRLDAVREFKKLPEAASLASANKRIRNILKKAPPGDGSGVLNTFENPAESALFNALNRVGPKVHQHFGDLRYKDALVELAALKAPVDKFFDDVMVMVDDPVLRNSRLDLLRTLDGLMNQVADLSKLAQ